ncbi:aspartyl-phosphate phosphatase Spo0E family protein [Bacillus timonensis]|nr:aspartyl-phosphate phosphatase Spo0E family protein [Bacillus timonensis]
MLKLAIEIKRRKMISLANKYGFQADETVQCSQELDLLLNMHQRADTLQLQDKNATHEYKKIIH